MSSTHNHWTAGITWTGPADDDSEYIAGALMDLPGVHAASFGPRHVECELGLEASSYSVAYTKVKTWLVGLVGRAGWEVSRIQLERADIVDQRLARPVIPELIGVGEAAEILGVSKQRVTAMAKGSGFPRPVVELAAGPVFLRSAVEAFAALPRHAGRPAKTEVYRDQEGKFRFRVKIWTGEVVASSEAYESKEGAMAGCEAVKRAAADAKSAT